VACEGYGWLEGEPGDCSWCAGVGYVYRSGKRDSPIPPADYAALADTLEALEMQRLHELGYRGTAKKPWQQAIRKDTQLGRNPYDDAGAVG